MLYYHPANHKSIPIRNTEHGTISPEPHLSTSFQNLEEGIAEMEQEVNLRLFSFLEASGLVGDSLNVHFPPQRTSGGCNVDN